MILAAAACAAAGAAGISYIFNDDESLVNRNYETVTVSSTIIDPHGIVNCVIHPKVINPKSSIYFHCNNYERKFIFLSIDKCRIRQLKVPFENRKDEFRLNFKNESCLIFYWSARLRGKLMRIYTKSYLTTENVHVFERHSMKISIGTQKEFSNKMNLSNNSSEIVLSYNDEFSSKGNRNKSSLILDNDDTFDSVSCYRLTNHNRITPIGILKKKKSDVTIIEKENNRKRLCVERLPNNMKDLMKSMKIKNVNSSIHNLSTILNHQEHLSKLQNSSFNNNNNNSDRNQRKTYSKFEYQNNNDNNSNFDGIILHRGERFGRELGQPMVRKSNENFNFSINSSSHSINGLNNLLSVLNRFLMNQNNIRTIEDLIRLYLHQGEHNFTQIMIHLFRVDPCIVEKFNVILSKWSKTQFKLKYT